MSEAEPFSTTYITTDDLAVGLGFCCDPLCHCELVRDVETTDEATARLHWWLASDEERGDC